MLALIFIIPGYLIYIQPAVFTTPKRVQGGELEIANIAKANAIGVLLVIVALYIFKELDYSRSMLVIFFGINTVICRCLRMGIRLILRDMRKRGLNQKHILLVGYSRAAEEYIDESWRILSGVTR